MRRMNIVSNLIAVLFWLIAGCNGIITQDGIFSYEDLVRQGWEAFQNGNYPEASGKFLEAKELNINRAESFTGLGWSYFKMDSLANAVKEFSICASQNDPTADLHAGWAFVLNAQKDYSNSNLRATEALALDSLWRFDYGLFLDQGDLFLLRAENYYLLGLFYQSLVEVQRINATFTANLGTAEGIAALAAEIERLKTGDEITGP